MNIMNTRLMQLWSEGPCVWRWWADSCEMKPGSISEILTARPQPCSRSPLRSRSSSNTGTLHRAARRYSSQTEATPPLKIPKAPGPVRSGSVRLSYIHGVVWSYFWPLSGYIWPTSAEPHRNIGCNAHASLRTHQHDVFNALIRSTIEISFTFINRLDL